MKIYWSALFHRATIIAPPDVTTSQSGDWTPVGGSRRSGRPKRTLQDTCREDLQEMGVSGSDMKPGALPVIVLNGVNSSPSVPVGTGGPKSK